MEHGYLYEVAEVLNYLGVSLIIAPITSEPAVVTKDYHTELQ